jgi:membrane protein
VPLLAISFSVLKGFGVHGQIEPFLYNLLAPLGDKASEITARIVEFVDNTRVGVLGFVGFALLFYTVVSLMRKIERAFNRVWRISAERGLARRFRDYLSVIVVGPVLIFTSLGITASLLSAPVVAQLSAIRPFGWILGIVAGLVPPAMIIAAFTFIYSFIPNTRVQTRSALLGGTVAGVLWNALGWAFAAFVASSTRYTAIYSGFAAPVVFMIWLYLGWLVLLIGASIAFYHQRPEYVFGYETGAETGNRNRERLALLVLCAIGRDFYAGRPPPSADSLALSLRAPMPVLEPVLRTLVRGRLLASTAQDPPHYLPGRPLETTPVREVLALVREDSGAGPARQRGGTADAAVDRLMARLDEATAGALDGLTLKDLALAPPPAGAEPGTGSATVRAIDTARKG